MYALLQALMALVLLVHVGRWAFGETTTGRITTPYSVTTLTVQYWAKGQVYTDNFMRYDIPYAQGQVSVRYLPHKPSVSRINSFIGIWAEPLAWWLFFTIGISMLLLTDNVVFSKGTTFHLHRRFPWISMDEYFPIRDRWFSRNARTHQSPPRHPSPQNEEGGKRLLN